MRPIFIGGCPRSGTTVLASLLGSHPDHLVTPETGFKTSFLNPAAPTELLDAAAVLKRLEGRFDFLDWQAAVADQAPPARVTGRQLMEWLVLRWGQKTGSPAPSVWIDHSPQNMRDARTLSHHFPDARLIHIVRDGRGIAASFRGIDGWGEDEIEPAARTWIEWLAHGFAAELSDTLPAVQRVRYEDLVQEPEKTLQRLCAAVEIDYTPAMKTGTGFAVANRLSQTHSLVGKPLQRSRVDAWRNVLSPREVERFEALTKNLLYCLDYEPDFGANASPATRTERRISKLRGFARRRWVLVRRRTGNGLRQLRQRTGRETSSSHA